MGRAMELVSGYAVNPSTTFTALTMATGDSNAVRNFSPPNQAEIIDQWALGATKGLIRTRSPRLHDNVDGITLAYAAALPVPLWPAYARERLYPQDVLTLEITGGGAETDGMSSLLYYHDLPGTDARLYDWEEIKPRILHGMGAQVAITTGATAGNYGGATAINSLKDQFKANTDYAILGYVTDLAIQTVGVRSSDFGNLRVGGPGTNNKIETRDWFVRLNQSLRLPTIPVFNAANKSNTLVDVIANVTATATVLTFECVELSTPGGATF